MSLTKHSRYFFRAVTVKGSTNKKTSVIRDKYPFVNNCSGEQPCPQFFLTLLQNLAGNNNYLVVISSKDLLGVSTMDR
jgi:hypothetical protein